MEIEDKFRCGVVSLYELMFRYGVHEFCALYQSLGFMIRDAQFGEKLSSENSPDYCLTIGKILGALAVFGEAVELDKSLVQSMRTLSELQMGPQPECRPSVLRPQLLNIDKGIEINLADRTFMFVPPHRAGYLYDIGKYEWATNVFVESVVDVIEATACYAFGRYTASVFHSMRVAEYGLRHVARSMKVTLTHKGKRMPVDHATWGKVIDKIESKIKRIRENKAIGDKREQEIAFYSDCAHQCAYLRDIYRNEVSHSGRAYKEAEALGVWGRVNDFMTALASGPMRGRLVLPASTSKDAHGEKAQ